MSFRRETSNNYDALRDFLLAEKKRDDFVMTFDEIEELLDFGLPRASQRASWWETEREPEMPQRTAVLEAGFIASRGIDGQSVRFKRKKKPRSVR
jgi:hypothetical protein